MLQLALLLGLLHPEVSLAETTPAAAMRASAEAPDGASKVPQQLQDIGIVDRLGNRVSKDSLKFRDDTGKQVQLSDYFSRGRPVLLAMIYYDCPNLCNFLLNGLVDTLKQSKWTPGNQFELVAVSIEPKETPDLAAKKKAAYIKDYGKPETAAGWHFLTGEQSQITQLSEEVGFKYRWDPAEKQWAHGAGLFVLTPEGVISRVLYGIAWQERDLKLALLEASNGKVGTIVDKILMFCYQYNPTTRKYSLYVTRMVQFGAILTVLALGTYILLSWRRQRKEELSPC